MTRRLTRAGIMLTAALAVRLTPVLAQAPGGREEPMDAFRRGVGAEARKREGMLDRLREIPPAPGGVLILSNAAEDDEALPAGDRLVLASENFDAAVFGVDRDDEVRRARLGKILAEQIERATRYNRLAPGHRARLRLAGQGDMKRFFDQIAERRREFELVRKDMKAGALFLHGLYAEASDYFRGPFGQDSLYDKTLNKILSEDPGRRPEKPSILDR